MYSFQELNNNNSFVTEQTNMMIDENTLNKLIDVSIKTQASYDFASIFHLICANDYKYSKSNVWYYFDNHIWRKSNNDNMLKNKILTQLYPIYSQLIDDNNKTLENITNEEQYNIRILNSKMKSIIENFEKDTFIEEITNHCKELFYDVDFLRKIDENQFLIGFNNGVYDLRSGELREGRRDDYITLCTNINKIDFSIKDVHYDELNKFICSIFPNEEKREYFMTYLSTCLQGMNFEQKFRIWVGDGANGKSKLEELFTTSFGDYAIKFPITLLTGKRAASNQCTPELVKAKGKRIGYFVEPSNDETINVGLMKAFTGGDKIYARGLNQDPIDFNPQFKLLLICNDVPKLPKNDNGLWHRLEIIEFTSRFKENPNPENPNEFLIDNMLSEKMKSWKEIFMAYLIDVYYTKYRESNGASLIVPEEVKTYTEKIKLSKGI